MLNDIKSRYDPLDKEIKKIEAEIKTIREMRCKGNEGIVASFKNLLQRIGGIYVSTYHGRSRNGVCVLKFF